ncbi:MAG: TolC family outer membrane protein [Pseudomonadota bacterium]
MTTNRKPPLAKTAASVLALALIAGIAGLTVPVHKAVAETLRGALAKTYKYNPTIDAERARLRATDEGVTQARAGYRPRITGDADISGVEERNRFAVANPFVAGVREATPRGYSIGFQQNLFDGFQTSNAVLEAEANVRAGRELLRDIERTVLLEAATAYMDVVRDRAIVELQSNNVRVLTRELRATNDRFSVGEVTKTDVAQARARRAVSVSALDQARANLKTSRAEYVRVVGSQPNGLREPAPPLNRVPRTLSSSIGAALNESPTIIGSLYLEEASRATVDRIRGQLLPQVTLEGSYANRFDVGVTVAETENTEIVGRVTVPFYQGGEVTSQVRAAKHTHVSRLQEIEEARTLVRRDVTTAWSQLQAATAQLKSDRVQVSANQTALSGVREEEKVGQRTLLDVLDAEQELLNAQVDLVSTKRDQVVAAYSVLSSIGRLDSATLGLTSTVYDPEVHYHEVRRKWWGISITHRDGRTVSHDLWESHGKSYK